ncbi:MAG: FKBP-type peptidyl-prolyl cis-trans isomerase [Eubacterium sp.]
MEKTNQNMNQDTLQEETGKKKISIQTIIVPVIIAIILIAFAGVVYYGKVVKPRNDIDKEVGFNVEDYIQLDKYTGFDYEITQDVFDECVKDETNYYEEVKRAAKETDQIDFDYTAYVDGKKDKNISQEEAEIVIGQEELAVFQEFAKVITGHKSGEKLEVKVNGADVTKISADETDYTDKEVTFKLKINSVSKLVVDEVNDKWVKENYLEDNGLETTSDFYEWCEEYIRSNAKLEVWQMAVDSANMSGYPSEVYDDIVDEFQADANYYADQFGMSTESYLQDFCGYTDETLEEEYLNEVKSQLVMWYIVRDQKFQVTDEEIESKYEELYEEVGYETVDEMKENYTEDEMKEAVLLDKAQNYVYDNSNIKESYQVPGK